MLVWGGYRLRTDCGAYTVCSRVTYSELVDCPGFRRHVELNMGPVVVRGVWYPWITAVPPHPLPGRIDASMSLPPPNKLAACFAALECATLRLRLLGHAGEVLGLSATQASEIAALADAVHNLPRLAQHWDRCDEALLRGMLEDFDKLFPEGISLLDAYDRAETGAS